MDVGPANDGDAPLLLVCRSKTAKKRKEGEDTSKTAKEAEARREAVIAHVQKEAVEEGRRMPT